MTKMVTLTMTEALEGRMTKWIFFCALFFSNTLYVSSQERYKFYSEEGKGIYTLEIGTKDYELYFVYDLSSAGYVLWEKGKVVRRKNSLILKSEKRDETSTHKMKLKRIKCEPDVSESKKNIFFTWPTKLECLEIISVKNKEFVRRILYK